MVRGNRGGKEVVAGLCAWSRPAGILLQVLSSENTLCLFGMSVSRRFERACVFCFGRKVAGPPFGWDDVHRFFQATDALTLV